MYNFSLISLLSNKVLITNIPTTPATVEAINMANLAWALTAGSSNANSEIKIDMVKPIPAIIAAPVMVPQLVFSGNSDIPNFTNNAEKLNIPMHFPTISPAAIPMDTGSNKPLHD